MRNRKHLFISYKSEDVDVANRVGMALRAAGFNVWWDKKLQTGRNWEEEIDIQLSTAEAVVVLWSKAATDSDWVKHEASVAKSRSVLAQARIEDCSIPPTFQSFQAADLRQWKNEDESAPSFQELVTSLRRLRRRRWVRTLWYGLLATLVTGMFTYAVIFSACRLAPIVGLNAGCESPAQRGDLSFAQFAQGELDLRPGARIDNTMMFNLHKEGPQAFPWPVEFKPKFSGKPEVLVVGLKRFELEDRSTGATIETKPLDDDWDMNGFKVLFDKQGNGKVTRVVGFWLAIRKPR